MLAPDPRSIVRHTLAPPAPPMLVAGTAWRSTVHQPRRSGWSTAVAMALICAALMAHIWIISAPAAGGTV